MNTLRRLLTPRDDGGQVYLDHDGNAVIRADKLAGALAGVDDTIDRLVQRLATATGRSEAEIRLSEGLAARTRPGAPGRRPDAAGVDSEAMATGKHTDGTYTNQEHQP